MFIYALPASDNYTTYQFIDQTLFFFNDTATTEIYPLSLHDALPIFGATDNFRDAPVKLRVLNFQNHFLGLALCDERELKGVAHFARLLLRIRRDDVPEIIAWGEAGNIDAGSADRGLLHCLREHRRCADTKCVRNRVLHRFPFEMDRRLLRVLTDDRSQIQRLKGFG